MTGFHFTPLFFHLPLFRAFLPFLHSPSILYWYLSPSSSLSLESFVLLFHLWARHLNTCPCQPEAPDPPSSSPEAQVPEHITSYPSSETTTIPSLIPSPPSGIYSVLPLRSIRLVRDDKLTTFYVIQVLTVPDYFSDIPNVSHRNPTTVFRTSTEFHELAHVLQQKPEVPQDLLQRLSTTFSMNWSLISLVQVQDEQDHLYKLSAWLHIVLQLPHVAQQPHTKMFLARNLTQLSFIRDQMRALASSIRDPTQGKPHRLYHWCQRQLAIAVSDHHSLTGAAISIQSQQDVAYAASGPHE